MYDVMKYLPSLLCEVQLNVYLDLNYAMHNSNIFILVSVIIFTILLIAWYGDCGKGSANVLILVATH